ncbi:unnamed protein product [Pseudo-nitzschia multistriata]|uniref:Pantoate--beta-alanine ligase n=1 Tax=Pseudo-nitzschia multistriata TaxID=183589 RepID=A0A448Z6M8_9STRA|nr:unnamed protein product [Pseudo-nitzschia multistriata]
MATAAAMRAGPNLYSSVKSFRAFRRSLLPTIRVGFVPTMGALHEGHLSLVKQAMSQNDLVVASIFVNPTQFGEGEDLDVYPRQLERDTELLSNLGVDHMFVPKLEDMYTKDFATYVECKSFDDIPESIVRPGHFRGVATIVTKLFNIVKPTNAYFGQKDAGQCVLIRRIVQDLDMEVNIVVGETVRESDGLAKSSRNAYLSETERPAAAIIYKSLLAAKDAWVRNPLIESSELISITRDVLESEPLVSEIQYVSVESMATMKAVTKPSECEDGTTISLGCIVGSVRLIDNIVLKNE